MDRHKLDRDVGLDDADDDARGPGQPLGDRNGARRLRLVLALAACAALAAIVVLSGRDRTPTDRAGQGDGSAVVASAGVRAASVQATGPIGAFAGSPDTRYPMQIEVERRGAIVEIRPTAINPPNFAWLTDRAQIDLETPDGWRSIWFVPLTMTADGPFDDPVAATSRLDVFESPMGRVTGPFYARLPDLAAGNHRLCMHGIDNHGVQLCQLLASGDATSAGSIGSDDHVAPCAALEPSGADAPAQDAPLLIATASGQLAVFDVSGERTRVLAESLSDLHGIAIDATRSMAYYSTGASPSSASIFSVSLSGGPVTQVGIGQYPAVIADRYLVAGDGRGLAVLDLTTGSTCRALPGAAGRMAGPVAPYVVPTGVSLMVPVSSATGGTQLVLVGTDLNAVGGGESRSMQSAEVSDELLMPRLPNDEEIIGEIGLAPMRLGYPDGALVMTERVGDGRRSLWDLTLPELPGSPTAALVVADVRSAAMRPSSSDRPQFAYVGAEGGVVIATSDGDGGWTFMAVSGIEDAVAVG